MNGEILRIVEAIQRDKNIDKEIVFQGIEAALLSAARKHFGLEEDIRIEIDRETGEISAFEGGRAMHPVELGRISAQAAKQVIVQKIREAERDAIYEEFIQRLGNIVNGVVQRVEGRNVIVNIGRAEGLLPMREQIRGESYYAGERMRAVLVDVKKVGQRVSIILSRTHLELVKQLFEIEVPEIAEGVIEIKVVAREAGSRSKIAVSSNNENVDCVGACVGVRGSRIKNVVDELNGEKIDIVRWDPEPEYFIQNALKPADAEHVILVPEIGRARAVVREDQLSLAIGKKGQNVRLAAKLTGWDIDIMGEEDAGRLEELGRERLSKIAGVEGELLESLVALGFTSAREIAGSKAEILMKVKGVGEVKAFELIRQAAEAVAGEIQLEAEARARAAEEAREEESKTEAEAEAGAATEEALEEEPKTEAEPEAGATEEAPEEEPETGAEAEGGAAAEEEPGEGEQLTEGKGESGEGEVTPAERETEDRQ